MMKMTITTTKSMEERINMMISIQKKSNMLSILIRRTKKVDIIKIRDIIIRSMSELVFVFYFEVVLE